MSVYTGNVRYPSMDHPFNRDIEEVKKENVMDIPDDLSSEDESYPINT